MIRKDILEAIENDFLTITAGNGYTNTISSVQKIIPENFSKIDQTALDFVSIFPLPMEQDANETSVWRFPIGFAIYYKNAGIDTAQSGVARDGGESYIDDIMRLENQTFANVFAVEGVQSIQVSSIEPYAQSQDTIIGLVYGLLTVEFIYN